MAKLFQHMEFGEYCLWAILFTFFGVVILSTAIVAPASLYLSNHWVFASLMVFGEVLAAIMAVIGFFALNK